MVNTSDICKVCSRKVQSFSYFIQCKNCLVKRHMACVNLKRDELVCDMWYCPCCVQNISVYFASLLSSFMFVFVLSMYSISNLFSTKFNNPRMSFNLLNWRKASYGTF